MVKPMNDDPQSSMDHGGNFRRGILRPVEAVGRWLDQVDPGTHRRIKGLRLVTAYGIAAALGTLQDIAHSVPSSVSLGYLAGSFALWASVSEGKTTRAESSRDLLLLSFAAALGAILFVLFLRPLQIAGRASIVPRVLSGPAERPVQIAALAAGTAPGSRRCSPEFFMGLQAATGALIIVALNGLIGLDESAWAITACTYVVAGSASGTQQRVRRRILGTLIGVPLGLACLPVAEHAPLLIWAAAALAMVVYAMALPERYDIACAAFAFTLIVTLAASGVHSIPLLAARAWETLLGGAIGLAAAMFIFPLRSPGPGE
jgi:hypothetical protein